jgi:heterotetrameric sarcosine oxidase gamma subunit
MTFANETYVEKLHIASPLSASLSNERSALTLSEITGRRLFHVRGTEDSSAPSEQKIGDVIVEAEGMFIRLRRDEFVVLAEHYYVKWHRVVGWTGLQNATLTDITHGRCGLLLIGQDTPKVLRKVCGLNFSDQAFPNMYAAQSSLAKVRTLIIRADADEDMPAYGLFVDRSLAQYVWDVVFDAGREFGISGFNLSAIRNSILW